MFRSLADHKVGHALAGIIAERISNVTGWKVTHNLFYRFTQIANTRDKWVVFVRHPWEIITSGYNYHKVCQEWWATELGSNFYAGTIVDAQRLYPEGNLSNDMTYQNRLRMLTTEDGLEYEMRHAGQLTVEAMYYWRYYDMPNVLTVKLEDFRDFRMPLMRILRHFGIPEEMDRDVVVALRPHDITSLSEAELLASPHITNKKLVPFVYKELWKEQHYRLAHELFPPDVLSKFGYEE
jgi:hypothetical protein